ncbi:unnamed protein product [Closterium sp. Naga37s-1]|nr:unnamed protein product [Closterium sp. Naga37s-1]
MAEELAPLDETLSPTDDGFHAHALGGSVFSGSDVEAPELGSLNASRGRAAERSSRGGGAGGAKRFGRGGMVMAVLMRLLAINKRILIPVALASLASMLMGYDIGVTSGAVLIVQRTYHLSIADKELFIGSFSFAAAISALLSGIGMTVGPLYCVELAPADSRGSLSALSELLSSLGLLLGYLISFLLSPSPKELLRPNEAVKQMLMLAVGAAFYQQVRCSLHTPTHPSPPAASSAADAAKSGGEADAHAGCGRCGGFTSRYAATGVPTMLYYTPEHFATMGLTSSAAILSDSLYPSPGAFIHQATGVPTMLYPRAGPHRGPHLISPPLLLPQASPPCSTTHLSSLPQWDSPPLPPSSLPALPFFEDILLFPPFHTPTNHHQATGVPTMLYYTPELFATMGLTSSAAILSASLAVALARTLASLVPVSILDEIGRRTMLLISTAGGQPLAVALARTLASLVPIALLDEIGRRTLLLISTAGELHTPALAASLAVALARTLASLVSVSLLDEIGRRTLLLISTAAQAIVLHTMNLGGEFDISSENPSSSSPLTPLVSRPFQSNAAALSVIAAANLTVFFAIGLSPISTLLPPEIFPLRLRAQGTGLAVAVSRLVAAALSSSFLSLVDATSPGFPFFVFAVLSAAAVPFLHSCMRETRGVKLEGASALFEPSLGGGVGTGGGMWGGGGVGGAAGAGEQGAVMDGHGRAIGRRARNVGGGDRASTS